MSVGIAKPATFRSPASGVCAGSCCRYFLRRRNGTPTIPNPKSIRLAGSGVGVVVSGPFEIAKTLPLVGMLALEKAIACRCTSAGTSEPFVQVAWNVRPPLPICTPLPPPLGAVTVQQTEVSNCVPSQSPVPPRFVPPFWTTEKPAGSPDGSSVSPVNERPLRPNVLRKSPWHVTFRQETLIVTSVLVTVAVNKVLLPSLPPTVN